MSNALAARGIDAPTGRRPLKEDCGLDMADVGRVPGPTVDEKGPLRDAGAVDRDMVDEAYELPRLCVLAVGGGCRAIDPALRVSGLAALGRVASEGVSACCANGGEGSIRDMLMALFAIVPGAMIPERELVIAELASRKPACGMRIRVDALVCICD